MKFSVTSITHTIFSFTSLPAPSVHLIWAFHVLPLHLTHQILPTLSTNHVSAVKFKITLLSAVSCHVTHLYNSPPPHSPSAFHIQWQVLLSKIDPPSPDLQDLSFSIIIIIIIIITTRA